jgi:hypothetical protein
MPNFLTLGPVTRGWELWARAFQHSVREYGDLTRTTTDEASETLRDEAEISSEGRGEDWLWTVCENVACAASDLVPGGMALALNR